MDSITDVPNDNVHVCVQEHCPVEVLFNALEPFDQFFIHRLNDVLIIRWNEHAAFDELSYDNLDDPLTPDDEFMRVVP
jgi:hypothetical protein